jgi:hypothetical protein
MAVFSALACGKPTTNLQPKPDAEPKTAVSAKTYVRRSSWAVFPFSSNLKIKTPTKLLIYSKGRGPITARGRSSLTTVDVGFTSFS